MLDELMERVLCHYDLNLPFVVYRKPHTDIVTVIFQKDAVLHILRDFSETGFVFAPFDATRPTVLITADERCQAIYVTQGSVDHEVEGNAGLHQKEFHMQLVRKGISAISSGKMQKVVLSRRAEVSCGTKPISLFQRLLANYQTAFCYLWHHPKVGTWLGATPEILLKSEQGQLTTMALAGTQKYDGNTNPNWGDKEQEEQRLVTEYVAKALHGKVASFRISETETIRAGGLLHLRTKISAELKNKDLAAIVLALHPTPAVCGIPLDAAKEFILENENYDREYYTGYLGELNLKDERERPSLRKNQENKAYRSIKRSTTFFVNLRCMQLKGSKAFIYVGGGITKDSNAEQEWQETVAKTNTMLKIVQN